MSIFFLKDEDMNLYFTAEAFLSLLGPIMENYPKETGGLLVGTIEKKWIDGKYQPTITINTVFPSLSARSRKGSWKRNEKKVQMMEGFVKSFNLLILGEYHSHPNGDAELSDDDEEYIEDQAEDLEFQEKIIDEKFNKVSWIEIIVSLEKKKTERNQIHDSSWETESEGCKLQGKVLISTEEYFKIIISAWAYISNEEEFYELPVFTEISSSFEFE
ncbi:MAG: Mov34/MPN/PAD-1 family protein [Asgard group archaeon]|nr:Mov34/MPN/PAD-1 family protein [Asgard group archaeon]